MSKDSAHFEEIGAAADSAFETMFDRYFHRKMRHFSKAFGLRCFPELMQSGVYDMHRLVKAMSVFEAINNSVVKRSSYVHLESDATKPRKLFDLESHIPVFIEITDMKTPVVATMFAYRTSWNCYSFGDNFSERAKVACTTNRVSCLEISEIKEVVDSLAAREVIIYVDESVDLDDFFDWYYNLQSSVENTRNQNILHALSAKNVRVAVGKQYLRLDSTEKLSSVYDPYDWSLNNRYCFSSNTSLVDLKK